MSISGRSRVQRLHLGAVLHFSLLIGISTIPAPESAAAASDTPQAQVVTVPLSESQATGLLAYGAGAPAAVCTLQWQGPEQYLVPNSLADGYRLAAFQDPVAQGCPGPYPFGVTALWWTVYFASNTSVKVRPLILRDTGAVGCPAPGDTIYAGKVYTLDPPSAGAWIVRISLGDTICINAPYFIGLEMIDTQEIIDIIVDGLAPLTCRTYRDTGGGWTDLVAASGFTHNMGLWTAVLDQTQSGCPANECPLAVTVTPPTVSGTSGLPLSATVSAADPDGGGPLRYFLVVGPGEIDSLTGVWTYLPACADVPGFTLTVEATDRLFGDCPSSRLEIPVTVTPAALTFLNCGSDTVHWGDEITRQLQVSGGCPPVAFSLQAGPGSVTPEGLWSVISACGDLGSHTVLINATDDAGQSVTCAFELVVTNTLPACQSPVAASAPWGELTLVPLGPLTDADGDTLTYHLTAGPIWGGIFDARWTATRPESDSADYTVCYSVQDGCGTSAVCCFLVSEVCRCECHADPQCDGNMDILDVVLTVNRAFRAAASIPFCPGYDVIDGRTDVDCSGATDIVDAVRMIDVVFRGGDPAANFCEPCGP